MATIGIALGSGAAKGWAHIGVLNELAKMGIKPDKVAGCSIGAIVGAAYAQDKLPELQQWVSSFSSWDVLGLMDLSWRKGGLIGGDRVFDVMQQHIGDLNIEQMNLPFAAVATDLYSGQEIWFKQGNLRHAVRASCSMPGILPPVKIGERWLVDGAVVNPVPVSVSRAMGVDLVIAVDLYGHRKTRLEQIPVSISSTQEVVSEEATEVKEQNHDVGFMDLLARGREYVSGLTDKFSLGNKTQPGMLAVMSQSMDILEQRHKRIRLMGDPPELLITPNVADIGTMEFHHADEAIAAGEQAVKQVAHIIEAVFAEHKI
ncbi:patatin-like phospholipase RssA [Shewanella sp. Isolate11]|uniref:patatin-like phospholipase RssA n=1 Tax=Shewanella sp. Isolate11 TaxID=2908530 RepID=UPI001EFC9980|nr:patatin-like phospholipase RssA [Shewanella sp. Isolate11]MCG9696273.1 patatin-like phospholipase RssA [Shewanella sp. Isolate11]